jgi:hypothetical protein
MIENTALLRWAAKEMRDKTSRTETKGASTHIAGFQGMTRAREGPISTSTAWRGPWARIEAIGGTNDEFMKMFAKADKAN